MDRPIGNEGDLNGTTAVEAVGAPAVDHQRIIGANGVTVYNADTVSHDVTFQKAKGVSTYVLDIQTIAAGDVGTLAKKVVLDDTDESLEVVSDATATTTEPTFDAAALDVETPAEVT